MDEVPDVSADHGPRTGAGKASAAQGQVDASAWAVSQTAGESPDFRASAANACCYRPLRHRSLSSRKSGACGAAFWLSDISGAGVAAASLS
jgi:hypothetical protein